MDILKEVLIFFFDIAKDIVSGVVTDVTVPLIVSLMQKKKNHSADQVDDGSSSDK